MGSCASHSQTMQKSRMKDDLPQKPLSLPLPREVAQPSTTQRPCTYLIDQNGHATMRSGLHLADEVTPLTNEEVQYVVEPMLALSESRNLVNQTCSDDIMLRACRGHMNKDRPTTHKWKVAASRAIINPHTAVVGEAIERIVNWRSRSDVQANELLTKSLAGAEEFHRWWPSTVTGYDSDGHPVVCERLKDIHTSALLSKFSLNEIILLRVQVMEMIQACVAKEGHRRGKLLSKHTHVLDLSEMTMMQFRRLSKQLKPIFKLLEEQYPNSLHSLFVVNAPIIFCMVWTIVKLWLDVETVARIHIHNNFDENLRKELRQAGIDSSALPSWLGGVTSGGTALKTLINDTIQQGGPGTLFGFSDELNQQIARVQSDSANQLEVRHLVSHDVSGNIIPALDTTFSPSARAEQEVKSEAKTARRFYFFFVVLSMVTLVFFIWHVALS